VGPRTPYGAGQAWPLRVDEQLRWLRTRMKQAAPQALVVAD
jgi:hypothetical protein